MGLEFFFAHVHFLCKVYLFLCEFIYCLYAWCTYAFRERICIYMTYTYIHVHDIYILYIYYRYRAVVCVRAVVYGPPPCSLISALLSLPKSLL